MPVREIDRIDDQLKRAFEGEAWHGPSVLEVLDGVTAGRAAARPVAGAHSIWEVVHHIAAWEEITRRRLNGEAVVAAPDVDWPPVKDESEVAWQTSLKALADGHHALRVAVSGFDDTQLSQTVTGTNYSVYFLLHGVIQHDLYHAGQIAVLKKACVEG